MQLEPALSPAEDSFKRLWLKHPPFVFVKNDTDIVKSYKIDYLLNKQTVKKAKGQAIEHLVCWARYGLEWDRWYNVKNLNNAAKLLRSYKKGMS